MFIYTTSGKRFQIDISSEDTISTLKTHITDEIGVPSNYQQLTFKGIELLDNSSLSSYGVDPSCSEIELGLTLKGGGVGVHCNKGCCGAGVNCTIL